MKKLQKILKNKKLLYPILIIFVLILIIFTLSFLLYKKQLPKIVDIKEKAVAYSDGSAGIVAWDNFNGNYTVYNAKVDALNDNGQYLAPDLKYRGGTWDRVVYSYNSSDNTPCGNIFYMDRDKKVARTLHSDFCIAKTLDEHDIKYFLGTKYTGEIAIIAYSDLETLATIKIPYASSEKPIWGEMVASNWELTKIIIPVGTYDKGTTEDTKLRLFLWDVEAGTLEDKTPANFNCMEKIRYGRSYNYDDDNFYIDCYNEMGKYIL